MDLLKKKVTIECAKEFNYITHVAFMRNDNRHDTKGIESVKLENTG